MKRVAVFLLAATGFLLAPGAEASAQVTSVTAGAGLAGGGVGPAVILNVAPGPGIRVVGDKVRVGFAGRDCPDGKYLVGFTPAGGLLCSCLGGICATRGSGADATGDSGGGPDIVSAELAIGNGNLTAKVLFAPGTYDVDLHMVGLSVDADRDPGTGDYWQAMGVEYVVYAGGNCLFPGALVSRYSAGWTVAGNGTTTMIDNGLLISVPMSLLGYDEGQVDVNVTVQTQVASCGSYTGVQDALPNLGTGVISLLP